jgi:hypothetical protein
VVFSATILHEIRSGAMIRWTAHFILLIVCEFYFNGAFKLLMSSQRELGDSD